MAKEEKTINEKLANSELDSIVLENNLAKIAYTLDKDYLTHLDDYGVFKFEEYCKSRGIEYKENETKNFMAIKITNFIINKDEKVIDCMKNVIGSFSSTSDSLAFLVHRKVESVDLYFIFKKDGEVDRDYVVDKLGLLDKSFKGNFPGSSTNYDPETHLSYNDKQLNEELKFLDDVTHISMLSSIPSDKSEDYISQGIEKLLNGFVPIKKEEEYSVLILAESITQEGIREIINGFEEMATSITPYAGHQFQTGKNDTESNGEMKSSTDTTGVSHAISKTHSVNIGANVGRGITNTSGINDAVTDSSSDTNTDSISDTEGSSISDTTSEGTSNGNTDTVGAHGGFEVFGGANYSHSFVRSKTTGTAKTIAKNVAKTIAKSTAKTVGRAVTSGAFSSVAKMLSFGLSGGYGYSWGKIDTDSESKSITDGTNHNITVGTSENTTYNYKSYQVSDLIQNLESNIKRLTESKSIGLWKTATYIFSNEGPTSRCVANYLSGLTQGDESYIESAKIKDWKEERNKTTGSVKANTPFPEIKNYLTHFIHPIFINRYDLNFDLTKRDEFINALKDELKQNSDLSNKDKDEIFNSIKNNGMGVNLIPITPTTNISTTELAKIFSLPSHSLPGLPVLECAEFGRNVATYDMEDKSSTSEFNLGKIFHMHSEEKLNVFLRKKSFASHTFITGSTGSGKSNTVFQLLSEANKNGCNFLVIEPAKGEYKNVFGKRTILDKDGNLQKIGIADVYGTNPNKTALLKINPFSFPSDIHILEHLDRLVEIFNVCWPMYAAMPAVLKEAIEKAYEDAGWDLIDSKNKYDNSLYPTFSDVARNIRSIIDSSDYDAENKGAYKGSLLTRLKSLTNGINGQLFTTDEIPEEDLFDKNVIIDLSRVGSTETKSLIMGLLILKLQEHRMTQNRMNADLNHITVLEEAHNLLKRTSTEISSESANLLGKSVEMLTNAIAEMRTYGEGFIIADQAPGLLDMAVIRNTNTKIIMRLPDLGDRELVGKAANLNENQIEELAKLPCGVAAVYQNEWVQPVLCKIEHYFFDESCTYSYMPKNNTKQSNEISNRIKIAKCLCEISKSSSNLKEIDEQVNKLKDKSIYKFSGTLFASCKDYIESTRRKPDYNKLAFIISTLFPEFSKTLKDSALKNPSKVEIWRNDLQEEIENVLIDLNMQEEINLRNNILQCILQNYILAEINKPNLLNELIQKKS